MAHARPAFGVCYYPEHWPQTQWAGDAAQMAEAGVEWARIAEFAWSRIEPRRGAFDWAWLDQAVETLAGAGLKIIMCTPTAAPPKWLVDEMPDMAAVDADGRPRKFGSRRHYSFSHAGYRAESRRITELAARRYGAHPAVQAWQTDNEYGCHDTVFSYCESARAGFRRWLAARYGSVERLNAAWGTVFWSMEYTDFTQIELPNLTVTQPCPGHALDFRRFAACEIAAFNREQAELIRKHSPGRPVAHNFMGAFSQFDARAAAEDLDIAAWDSYPLGMLQNMQQRARPEPALEADCLRTGDPDFQAFHHDLYRGMGRLWVMEQQPGPVNWARFNPVPAQGAVRLWTWEAAAHGAEVVSYFRWRQAPFAQEQMHAGLMLRNGASAPGLAEIKQARAELDKAGMPEAGRADIALIYDYESAWMAEIEAQTEDFDHLRLVLDVYRAARRNGGTIDVIGPEAPVDGYKLVLAPGLMHADGNLCARLAACGARVLAGPRAGVKTEDFQIPENLTSDGLAALTGFRTERADALPRRLPLACEWNGVKGEVSVWVEHGAVNGAGEGRIEGGGPLLVSANRGAYLTAWPDETLLKAVLAGEMKKAGVECFDMPPYVRMRRSGAVTVVTNYGPAARPLPAGLEGEITAGEAHLPPAGVTVLRAPEG